MFGRYVLMFYYHELYVFLFPRLLGGVVTFRGLVEMCVFMCVSM